MPLRRDLLLLIVLTTLAAPGCNAKTSETSPATSESAEAESGSADRANSERPSAENPTPAAAAPLPKGPAKPSAEQLAKWQLPDFEPLVLLACSDGFGDPAVLGMALSPDGKQFALGGAKLTLWNTPDSQPFVEMLAKYTGEQVDRPLRAVAISPDGKWLAAGDQKGMVRVWNFGDQQEVVAIKAHDGHITQLAISPDSHLLATTSYSGDVNLWQLPGGEKLKSLKLDKQEIKRLVFLSDTLLASAGSEAAIWNIETGQKETALTTKYVTGPALGLSSDRSVLAFNDSDSTLQFWDVPAAKPSGVALPGASVHLIEFSPDGKWLATYSQDSTVRIWDAATGSVVQVIDADGGLVSAIKFLPETAALLVASVDGRVRIWGVPSAAEAIGIEPIQLPALPTAVAKHQSLTSAQLQSVIDIRSFPRLPGAVPQWSDFGMASYTAPASQKDAELFYRFQLEKAGWKEVAPTAGSQPGLTFRKDDCELNVSFAPATAPTSPTKANAAGPAADHSADLQVSLRFAGNYDARWLPKFSPIKSKSSWDSFSSVSYRTKADLTDVEVALLKQFHDAGWTAYSRLAAAGSEDPKSRHLSLLQGGSVLTVSIGYPADSAQYLFVQTSVNVSNKSIPIPPDAGWIELDSSTDLQFVINTKLDLQQTTQFFDTQMAAEGWLAREAGRHFNDERAWLPYIRGQQEIFLRLSALPDGGTRIVAGDAARSSWQLEELAKDGDKKDAEKTEKPGLEAADFVLPTGATAVKFEVDQKQIEFAVPGSTPAKLGQQFVTQMESLGWQRESAGIESPEYVFITFSKSKAEIQLRARAEAKQATAMISGDGLLWTKPLSAPPERVSYGTWLRRDHKPATLDLLDEFSAEMHKIPAGKSK